jgi:hypothetical protein
MTDFVVSVYKALKLPLPEGRLAEIEILARENHQAFSPLKAVSLDKSDEPSTFVLSLLEEGVESE